MGLGHALDFCFAPPSGFLNSFTPLPGLLFPLIFSLLFYILSSRGIQLDCLLFWGFVLYFILLGFATFI